MAWECGANLSQNKGRMTNNDNVIKYSQKFYFQWLAEQFRVTKFQ